MMGENVVEKKLMDCPVCGNIHYVEMREKIADTIIKGEVVEYKEWYYFCDNAEEDECEFESARLCNMNLLNARNAYRRKKCMLTSDEIVGIREMYGLSQIELARLLGWGEATVSRYESKAIQDEAYDRVLRTVKSNPLELLRYLESHKEKFSKVKYLEIRNRINENLGKYGKEYLSRRALESEYVKYDEACDENGNALLNIDKVEAVINYFASNVPYLYKVKMMKLIWYSDVLSYNNTGKTITGLVYRHEKMGALPIGNNRIMTLENVLIEEEYFEVYDNVSYSFVKNDNIDMSVLSDEEIEILKKVSEKFKDYSGMDIMQYMHNEKAYTDTESDNIIPFSLTKDIKIED